MYVYAGLFFFETATLYTYYYTWDHWKAGRPSSGTGGSGSS
jgi:hypothetical protein